MAGVLRSLNPSQLKVLSKLGKTPDVVLDRLVNDYDSKALTPLHLACIYNHAEVAGFLLECTANPFMLVREIAGIIGGSCGIVGVIVGPRLAQGS